MEKNPTQEAYNTFANKFAETRTGKVAWKEFDLFLPVLSNLKYPHILDMGCGAARMVPFCEQIFAENFSYVGVDYSSALLQIGKERYLQDPRIRLELSSMEDWKSTDAFDVIFLIASFHHLLDTESQQAVLKKLYNLLKPKGVLCMTNWNLLEEERYKDCRIGQSQTFNITLTDGHKEKIPRLYFGFSPKELAVQLDSVGFKEILLETGRNIVSVHQKSGY